MVTQPLNIAPDHPAFAGHFPGQPLLPGASLLAEVMEAARRNPAHAALIGAAPRLANAKFLAPIRPGDSPTLSLSVTGGQLGFEVHCNGRLAASGRFEAAR